MVNSLTTKMQIGGPMASAYLLGHSDHYSSHEFKPFFWRPFVREVRSVFVEDIISSEVQATDQYDSDKVMLQKRGHGSVALSAVLDYTLRPFKFENVPLFD